MKPFSIILSAIITIFIAFMAYNAYIFSLKHDSEMLKTAQNHKIENKIDNYFTKPVQSTWDDINNYISNYGEEKQEVKEIKIVEKKLPSSKAEMLFFTKLYFVGLALLLLTYFISSKEVFIFSIISASIISWFVGILAPIMTIEVFKDLPILGYTIFKYDSKGIWSTVENLWLLENYFISIIIALFSMLIPVIKTIAMSFSIFKKTTIHFIDFIGKWSMADVFIVALLLSNLSLNTDEFTNAKVQIAIYFFSSYVILSILASYIIKLHIKEENQELGLE